MFSARVANSKGFTLLEVMLVLLLMGLAAAFVTLNTIGGSNTEALEKQVRRLQVLVDMASDFAILNQQELGLRVNDDNQYVFMVLDDDGKWQPLSQPDIFLTTDVPDAYQIQLEIDNLPWQQDEPLFDRQIFDESLSLRNEGVSIGEDEPPPPPPPQILITSSGEVTPFQMIWSVRPGYSSGRAAVFVLKAEDMPPLMVEGPLERAP